VVADVIAVSWGEVVRLAGELAGRWRHASLADVYGVPQGGCVPAVMVAQRLGLSLTDEPGSATLVVDDLVDSGRTAKRFDGVAGFDALYRKPHSPADVAPDAELVDGWLAFPWERDEGDPTDAVVRLLQMMGEDPGREGLADTPARVVRAWREMTAGYRIDPAEVLSVSFDERCDELVVLRGIEFYSTCEHHLLPIIGQATVGYLPGERVIGLSKLARIVDCFARRLQVQERMTRQIAEALDEHLQPRGVGVVVSATHGCMTCRGVMKPGAEMVTSALLGFMRDNAALRAEFLGLHGLAARHG
jgi:GTP cyclohydrolase I